MTTDDRYLKTTEVFRADAPENNFVVTIHEIRSPDSGAYTVRVEHTGEMAMFELCGHDLPHLVPMLQAALSFLLSWVRTTGGEGLPAELDINADG